MDGFCQFSGPHRSRQVSRAGRACIHSGVESIRAAVPAPRRSRMARGAGMVAEAPPHGMARAAHGDVRLTQPV